MDILPFPPSPCRCDNNIIWEDQNLLTTQPGLTDTRAMSGPGTTAAPGAYQRKAPIESSHNLPWMTGQSHLASGKHLLASDELPSVGAEQETTSSPSPYWGGSVPSSLRLNLLLLPFLVTESDSPHLPAGSSRQAPLPPSPQYHVEGETGCIPLIHPPVSVLQTLRRIKAAEIRGQKASQRWFQKLQFYPGCPGNGLRSKYQLPFLGEITKSITSHGISWRWQVVCFSFFRNSGQIN